ncbi:RNA polymerase sigma factor SigX [Brevibacillus laterosporus]|nr:RNA polymerase sigma factor SigX [Brevibacillus laterosporus]
MNGGTALYDEDIKQQVLLIYEQYYLDVYHFLLYYTGNQNDTEDLTQEVFVRVIRSLARYENRANLKTWLFAIAKHIAIDYHRKKRWKSLFSIDVLKKHVSSDGLPEKEVESWEEEQELIRAIQKLPQHYRMVVILRGIQGYSVRETASIMDYSESQVKVTLHRALKKLEKELAGRIGGELYDGLAKR